MKKPWWRCWTSAHWPWRVPSTRRWRACLAARQWEGWIRMFCTEEAQPQCEALGKTATPRGRSIGRGRSAGNARPHRPFWPQRPWKRRRASWTICFSAKMDRRKLHLMAPPRHRATKLGQLQWRVVSTHHQSSRASVVFCRAGSHGCCYPFM